MQQGRHQAQDVGFTDAQAAPYLVGRSAPQAVGQQAQLIGLEHFAQRPVDPRLADMAGNRIPVRPVGPAARHWITPCAPAPPSAAAVPAGAPSRAPVAP
jgi:hypothetical protein